MVTAATPMPSDSSAAITMRAAVAVGADQLDLDRVAAELRLQLLRRALDDDLPVVDDRQPPRQPVGLLEAVRTGGRQDPVGAGRPGRAAGARRLDLGARA